MKQDKSLKCMGSIRSVRESMVQRLFGSSSLICLTTSRLQLSLKTIYSVYMQDSHQLFSIYLILKKSKGCRRYRMKDPLPIWCGPILTQNPAIQALHYQQEVLDTCLEWMLWIDFSMRTECPKSFELTSSAWRDIKCYSMGSSAQFGVLLITATDFKILQAF